MEEFKVKVIIDGKLNHTLNIRKAPNLEVVACGLKPTKEGFEVRLRTLKEVDNDKINGAS